MLKAGTGSGAKIAHSGKHALYGNPPRWHKISDDKPAPKGAPVAAHPKSAGHHAPAEHFTPDQWAALQLPETNVNAPSFNKALEKLRSWSDAGDVTAIVGAGYGTNTYGKKLATIANHLLGLHGSQHKVEAGQASGSHAATLDAAPADPHPTGLPEHIAPKSAFHLGQNVMVSPDLQHPDAGKSGEVLSMKLHGKDYHYTVQVDGGGKEPFQEGELTRTAKAPVPPPEPVPVPPPAAQSDPLAPPVFEGATPGWPDITEGAKKAFDAGDWEKLAEFAEEVEHVTSVNGKKAQAYVTLLQSKKPAAAPAAKLKMPEFAEGKTTTGVKALYEKVGKKIIDHAHAGNAAVVAELAEPEKKMWQGKTPNSKKLLALHAAAMAHAQASVPADAPYSIKSAKAGNLGNEGYVNTIYGTDFEGIEAALGLKPGALADEDSTTYVVTNHKGQTFHVYKHAGALSVRTAGKNDNNGSAGDLVNWLKGKQMQPDGPKEGDTKPGADGSTLVLKNGRWVTESGVPPIVLGYGGKPEKPKVTGFIDVVNEVHDYIDNGMSGMLEGAIQSLTGLKSQNALIALAYAQAGLTFVNDAKPQPAAPPSNPLALSSSEIPVLELAGTIAKQDIEKANGFALAGDATGLKKQIASLDIPGGESYKPLIHAKKLLALMQAKKGSTAPAAPPGASIAELQASGALPTAPASGLGVEQLKNLQSIPWYKQKLPAENSNAKSHNAAVAKIEAMAFAGDAAGLQAFIDSKAAAKQTYAKKQGLLAQTALAALGGNATAAVATEPPPADLPLSPKMKEALETLAADGAADSLQAVVDGNGPAAVKAYAKKLLDRLAMTAEPPAPPPEPAAPPVNVTVTASKLTHTTDGHNKFWAVSKSPDGKSVMTTYGKIGSKGSATVKTFPTTTAAQAEVNKLLAEKLNKGYKPAGATDHTHEVGPKEGDTKAGADGMLVLKDGHWVKVADENNAGNWVFNAEDMGMSGASTIGNDAGLIAYHPDMGAEYHTEVSMHLNSGEPELAAGDLKALVQKMAAGGHVVPPLAMLQKLDFAFKASDMPGAAAEPAPSTGTAPPAMDDWKQTGPQGGSNPGGRFRDPAGQEWYCKFPGDADMARSEVLAAKLYALAGLASQDAMLITKGGKIGIASKWTEVKKAGTAAKLAAVDGALSGFAVDAWLGNWDVVGMGLDNLQVGADGKAVRVDAGGSLEYRAQGAKKPFGTSVTEIDTLRDKKLNPHSAAVFAKMTVADLSASAAKVVTLADSQIRALVAEHGPGGEFERKALAATLIARKNDLQKRFPKAGKTVKKRLDPTALPVTSAALPKVHDFENWNGPGKGLSSKDFVNKANAVVEHQIRALAGTGNLVALKALKFAQVDVSTGAPTGAMLPISAHPSKHVVQYHSDLVQLLDEVANPPEPLKVFQETEVGTLASLAAAFPPKPFGTTVDKVSSNEKMGFWVALGKVSGVAKFKPAKVSNYSAHAIAKASEKYKTASKLAKHFMSSIQSSGSYNDLFRDGKTHDIQGNSLKDVAKAALAHATEMPEGTSLYRWQKMSPKMLEHIMSAEEGTVFQATGPMCTSYSDSATKGFGTHRVAIRYAKGAKAVESFGSGKFAGEKEVTTLPNARFVILSRKMVPDVEHGNPTGKRLELEVLMLPPDLGL